MIDQLKAFALLLFAIALEVIGPSIAGDEAGW